MNIYIVDITLKNISKVFAILRLFAKASTSNEDCEHPHKIFFASTPGKYLLSNGAELQQRPRALWVFAKKIFWVYAKKIF